MSTAGFDLKLGTTRDPIDDKKYGAITCYFPTLFPRFLAISVFTTLVLYESIIPRRLTKKEETKEKNKDRHLFKILEFSHTG